MKKIRYIEVHEYPIDLVNYMKKHKLTYRSLAKKIGVGYVSLNNIARGAKTTKDRAERIISYIEKNTN